MADQQKIRIAKPQPNDVLSGRGNSANSHTGNLHFRALVKSHRSDYVQCPKNKKSIFARLIYDEIKSMNPPGRFLKQDDQTHYWYDIGKKAALVKIRQALREGAPDLLREMETLEQVRRHSSIELEQGTQPVASGNAGTGSTDVTDSTGVTNLVALPATMPFAGLTSSQAPNFAFNGIHGSQLMGVASANLSSDGAAVTARAESTTSSLSDDNSTENLPEGSMELKLKLVRELLAMQQQSSLHSQFEEALKQMDFQANEKQASGIVSDGSTVPTTQDVTTHQLKNPAVGNIQQSTLLNVATQNVTTQAAPSYQVNPQNGLINPHMNPMHNFLCAFGNNQTNLNTQRFRDLPTNLPLYAAAFSPQTNHPVNATASNPQTNATLNDSLLSFLLNRIEANPNQSKKKAGAGK